MHNIDAERGGDCVVLCQLLANYSPPPPSYRAKGLDGVILFDAGLEGQKTSLAIDAAITIVNATTSNDRLGLVVLGQKVSIISELIMCTNPYRLALQNSIREFTSTQTAPTKQVAEGIRLALDLLAKDARNGGHIFLVSDGRSFHDDAITCRVTPTSIHCISIGGLTYASILRQILRDGSFLEFRSPPQDSPLLIGLISHLTSQTHYQPLSTVRCRLTYPPESTIVSVSNHSDYTTECKGQISLTLGNTTFRLH
jgi:hypothetical protein